ncbi:hypothetical protein AKJ29_13015 [Aliiroseovarius crassostreae]|uniref:Prolyl 4-hydroxylase alpha subunit Fe(2+) 2OG dioxygenase domain-containing protein n=2 Tax=Aliiroseovarius crassostreae TaxID=154981 RepID=A0A0P7KN44_9RHOB|nr:hypothetical protein AKJ29_13015 [Aliiroseovarius crassostreae]
MEKAHSAMPTKVNDPINMVGGFRLVPGQYYNQGLDETVVSDFQGLFDASIELDPYSPVRVRGMLKIAYDVDSDQITIKKDQFYLQSASANSTDGGVVRRFKVLPEQILEHAFFQAVWFKDKELLKDYADQTGMTKLDLSIHFIRYRVEPGGASYSSPVWLHQDDEPLVFIHLVKLTENAIGADSVVSGMDDMPTGVYRLSEPFDTLIVDPTMKHAVTPLGSTGGEAHRDVMLVNLEHSIQQN